MHIFIKISYYLILLVTIFIGTLLLISIVPIPGDFNLRIVQSGSMEPAIKTGSIILTKSEDTYSTGDIITFHTSDSTLTPVTHRVIATENTDKGLIFKTKGDANRTADLQTVKNDKIIGKTVLSIPYLGYVINFTRQPIGFIILIIIPVAIIVTDECKKIYKEVKKMKVKNIK